MERMRASTRKAKRARVLGAVFLAGCIVASACGSDGGTRQAKPSDRVTIRGTATLDGAPLTADFLGAVVRADGLVTPCQADIPSVTRGSYGIRVLAQEAGSGCGRRGAEVLLWTFVGDTKIFSTSAVAWPPRDAAQFDVQFSSTMPRGDAPAVTELSGEVFDQAGRRLPPGTRVEAYIGATRCGVASVRDADDTFTGYILSVVGPDSIGGCTQGAPITFRINGRPAIETSVNDLGPPPSGSGGSFRLTQS